MHVQNNCVSIFALYEVVYTWLILLLCSYTSYYEGLLKVNTQLLYTKEQEIKLVRDQLQQV